MFVYENQGVSDEFIKEMSDVIAAIEICQEKTLTGETATIHDVNTLRSNIRSINAFSLDLCQQLPKYSAENIRQLTAECKLVEIFLAAVVKKLEEDTSDKKEVTENYIYYRKEAESRMAKLALIFKEEINKN